VSEHPRESGEHPELAGLAGMARQGEQAARPLPAEQVRQLGDRRRRRRLVGAVGGALAVVIVAAAAIVLPGVLRGGGQTTSPPVAASPSQAPTTDTPASAPPPASNRRVTTKNLLTTDDVPVEDWDTTTAVLAKPGTGRVPAETSVCWASEGRVDLGVVNEMSRNFAYEIVDPQDAPDPGPLRGQPVIYTQALQFPDAATAKKARDVYADWLSTCKTDLKAKGYDVLPDLGFTNRSIPAEGGAGSATEVVYQRPGGADGENAFWESVGLTLVKDRLMITVYLHYGQDFNVTLDSAEGDLLHPQLTLVESSAERLVG
jgi:hypothetical protein